MSRCPNHHKKALNNIGYLNKPAPKTIKAKEDLVISCSNPFLLKMSKSRVILENGLPQSIGSFVEKLECWFLAQSPCLSSCLHASWITH